MKNKFVILLICSTLLLAGVGGTIAYEASKNSSDEIQVEVESDRVTERVVSVTDLSLYPGKEKTYTLKFNAKSVDEIDVSLGFEETETGKLKNYVIVTVSSGDKTETIGLNELLGGKTLTFSGKIEIITITYRMDENVGNEAQGAATKFDIRIKASAE